MLAEQQSNHAHRVYGHKQQIVDQHTKAASTPARPSIHSTSSNPCWVQYQPRGMRHCDAHSNRAPNGYHPCSHFYIEAQWIAAIVATNPGQCGTKYSKHNVVSDAQGERIHPVNVVCYYFLAGAAGVAGADTAGLAAGATVAFGFSV